MVRGDETCEAQYELKSTSLPQLLPRTGGGPGFESSQDKYFRGALMVQSDYPYMLRKRIWDSVYRVAGYADDPVVLNEGSEEL